MIKLIPTALYTRYSSNNQREESIDAQIRAIEEYACRNRYHIVARYIDEAMSATTDDRESFQRMIAESARREWKVLLVHKLDRFARNKYDSAINKRILKQNGVRVVSVLENLDDSPESVILESVLEGMAEYYSRNLSREVKKGLRENAYQGRLTGGFPPLGYDVDAEGHYIVNEEEADSVRLIFKWTLEGTGYKEIASRLSAMDRHTKAGNQFRSNSIHDILRNEKYKGVLVHSRYVKGLDGKRNRHKTEVGESTLALPGMVPEIVDLSTWTQVNDRMDKRTNVGRGTATRKYLLTGIIECGSCGSKMEGGRARDYLYRCRGQITRKTACSASRINADEIEQYVVDLLRDQLLNENSIKALLPNLKKVATKKALESAGDAIILNERITEINEQSSRLVDAIMDMGGSASIKAKLKELDDERAKIVRTLTDIELETKVYTTSEDEIADILYSDSAALENGDDSEKWKVISKYVRKVIVNFDPNDPPRSGHKRNYSLEVEAVIPKSSHRIGTSKDVHTLRLYFQSGSR